MMIEIIRLVTAQKKVIIMLENAAHGISVRSLFNEGRCVDSLLLCGLGPKEKFISNHVKKQHEVAKMGGINVR